jgi:hypothetical protein
LSPWPPHPHFPPGAVGGHFFDMSAITDFTYDFSTNPSVAYVRLLIADTVNTDAQPAIFSDSEINAFYVIQMSQFQSSMFFSGPAGRNLPSMPLSYLRVAALALDSLASNKARLSSITKLLDVSLSPEKAAAALRTQAQEYRTVDDESGAFVIIEQCSTQWAFVDRYWAQVQRQTGGSF